jgi:GT2 family glycosyltransferase
MADPVHVSIICCLYEREDLTRRFLEQLPATVGPAGVPYEVVLVDDGSTDGTHGLLDGLRGRDGYQVLVNHENRGFAYRANQGAKTARGRRLLFINNDVELERGWLEPMLDLADDPAPWVPGHRRARLGCIGNIQRQPGSRLIDHAGVAFNPRGTPVHAGQGLKAGPRGRASDWFAVSAACLLVERELFLQHHGFDECYRNGFEDIDFCLRLSRRNHVHLVAHASVIGHWVSQSPGRKDAQAESANAGRFRAAWDPWLPALARIDRARLWLRAHPLADRLIDPWRTLNAWSQLQLRENPWVRPDY